MGRVATQAGVRGGGEKSWVQDELPKKTQLCKSSGEKASTATGGTVQVPSRVECSMRGAVRDQTSQKSLN